MRQKTVRRGTKLFWGTLPLIALWLVPVIAISIALPLAVAEEKQSVSPEFPGTVTVGSRNNEYRTAVTITVKFERAPEVRLNTSGLVTQAPADAVAVVPGVELVKINSIPVLAYPAVAPLYRDLGEGDTGEDVESLESFLAQMSLLPAGDVDQRFGWGTRDAVKQLQISLGVEEDGLFRLAYVAFVPHDLPVVVGDNIYVGDRLESGDSFAKGAPNPESIEIQSASENTSLVPLSKDPLSLSMGTLKIDIPSLDLGEEDLGATVDELNRAADAGLLRVDEETGTSSRTYSGGVLSRQRGDVRGLVPGTAVYVSSVGNTCVFLVTEDAPKPASYRLDVLEAATGELGTEFVDVGLVGEAVVRDVHTLTTEELETCK